MKRLPWLLFSLTLACLVCMVAVLWSADRPPQWPHPSSQQTATSPATNCTPVTWPASSPTTQPVDTQGLVLLPKVAFTGKAYRIHYEIINKGKQDLMVSRAKSYSFETRVITDDPLIMPGGSFAITPGGGANPDIAGWVLLAPINDHTRCFRIPPALHVISDDWTQDTCDEKFEKTRATVSVYCSIISASQPTTASAQFNIVRVKLQGECDVVDQSAARK